MQYWWQKFILGFTLLITSNIHADVILHAFNWKYSDITANVTSIKNAGYKAVLISPPAKSSGNEWWGSYQPQDMRVIDNPLGNKEDLQKLLTTLSKNGIAVYADVVLNHMANEAYIRNDLNYPGNNILATYANNKTYFERQKLFGDLNNNVIANNDFHPAFCINNWNDVYQVQNGRLCGGGSDAGLPDLAATNNVIALQKQYLQALKNMGIKGFRLDAVKHMDNYYLSSILTPDLLNGSFVFGEVITGGGTGNSDYEQFLKSYLASTSHSAYDFPLFATIRNAFSINGSMSQLANPSANGQALANNRAVTFSITHDIPTNDGFRYQIMEPTDELLANAYLLGRDGGVPMIYSDHGETKNKDGTRWVNYYNRSDIQAMVKFHNATHGTTMEVIASNNCYLVFKRNYTNGDAAGIVAINKCGFAQNVAIDTNRYKMLWHRNYVDVLNKSDILNIGSNSITITIPARSAKMWLAS